MTRSIRIGAAALTALTATTLATTGLATVPAGAAPANADVVQLAPLRAAGADGIAGRYIVVLDDGTTRQGTTRAADRARTDGAKVTRVYRSLNGYAAAMTADELAEVRSDPAVAYVEQDRRVTTMATQSNATWGLDRIDQRNLPLSSTYTYNATGAGVDAYIIDTGIRAHAEFGSRLVAGASAINDGRGSSDCNGHGTHVAGTVGGTTYGVAKQSTLIPVRVLDCNGSGTNAGVIAGMDWVAANASGPSVANLSLGGGASTAVDSAVARMTSAGVTVVVAAGNENQNACQVSPARAPSAITTGSTTRTDARSSFSNFGSCVDVFAPGSDITSAWYTSSTSTNTISGTSMASPHVAGAAALYLQGNPSASPAAVSSAITGAATTGVVSGAGSGSPNRLLYSLF